MALTDREIRVFAEMAVKDGDKKAALGYYYQAQADVRASGWRVTQRVKDVLWSELQEIKARAIAPKILLVEQITSIRMVAGGEKRHPNVIMVGPEGPQHMQWVGHGWIDCGKASVLDQRQYPLVISR